MLIGSRQRLNTFGRLPSFTIESNSIKQVEFTKSLGVNIDENLTWNAHIEHISKKIASCIDILKRSRSFVPFETLLCIYNALVQPHFDYCSVVWGNCNKSHSIKVQKLQNRAARILTSFSYDANADDLFVRLGWQKRNLQRELKQLLWSINLLMVSPLITRNRCLLIGVQYLPIFLEIARANKLFHSPATIF